MCELIPVDPRDTHGRPRLVYCQEYEKALDSLRGAKIIGDKKKIKVVEAWLTKHERYVREEKYSNGEVTIYG